MNFLWIEDNEKITHLKKKYFGEVKDFNEKLHNLIIPTNFDEALYEIKNANKKYDFIILDIDLENFEIGESGKKIYNEFPNIINENEFMKEAGFHLYLKLLPQGFTRDRIIFLTGNTKENQISTLLWQFEQAYKIENSEDADIVIEKLRKVINDKEYDEITELINNSGFDEVKVCWKNLADEYEISQSTDNTFDNFRNQFQKARLHLPFSIHKDKKEDFHTWLKGCIQSNEQNNYITLRRSIIKGCIELIEITENNGLNDLLIYNITLHNEFSNLSKEDVILYLTKLKNYFPIDLPENKNQLFYSFTRELSDLWEKSKGYLKREDVKHKDDVEYNFKNYCQNQMKLLRNWTTHHQLSDKLTENEIAFYFLIAMRALFNLETDKIYEYEELLMSIYQKTGFSEENINKNLANSYRKTRSMEIFKYANPNENKFSEIIKSLGSSIKKPRDIEETKDISIRIFYQNYFHSLNPSYLNFMKVEKLNERVIMFLEFKFPELKNHLFLNELAKSIYSEAFENLE